MPKSVKLARVRLLVEPLEGRVVPGDTLGLLLGRLGGLASPVQAPLARNERTAVEPAALALLGNAAQTLNPKPVGLALDLGTRPLAPGDLTSAAVTQQAAPQASIQQVQSATAVVQTPEWGWTGTTFGDSAGSAATQPPRQAFVDQGDQATPAPIADPGPGFVAPARMDLSPAAAAFPLALTAMVAQEVSTSVSVAGRLLDAALVEAGASAEVRPDKDAGQGPGIQDDNDASVALAIPFDGYWDRFALAHPSFHSTPWGGDWSVDYYNAPGTAVIFDAWDWYYGGYAYGQVVFVRATCASGVIADGGYSVKIDIYTSAGDRVGWVLYAHLTQPTVSAGQWIGGWTHLGNLSRWRYSSCYQVTTDAGVHTHVEVYNYNHYACYVNWGSGAYLEWWWAYLGMIGGHGAFAARTACPW